MNTRQTDEVFEERRVKSHFDDYSARWGQLYTEQAISVGRMDVNLRAECARELVLQVARNGSDNTRPRILDIGCGTGHVLGCLDREEFDIIAYDFSESMIRIASAAHPHTGFLVADARHIPFRYNTMDIVTMMGALEYIPKSAEVVAAIASVLRPDGWLILSFPNWRSLFRRAHAFERTLTAPLRRLRGRKSLNSGAQSGEKEGYRHYQWSERTARELLEAHGFAPEYVRYCTYGLKTPWLDGNRFNAALGRWLGIRYGSTGFMAKNLAWTLVIAAKKLHSRSTKHYSP